MIATGNRARAPVARRLNYRNGNSLDIPPTRCPSLITSTASPGLQSTENSTKPMFLCRRQEHTLLVVSPTLPAAVWMGGPLEAGDHGLVAFQHHA